MKQKLYTFYKQNLFFLALMLVVLLFMTKRMTGYVAADAFQNFTDSAVSAYSGHDYKETIRFTDEDLRSIVFMLAPSDKSSEYTTSITVYDSNDNTIASYSMVNSDSPKLYDVNQKMAELFSEDELATVSTDRDYKLYITSDCPDADSAVKFYLNEAGTIWHRATYNILSASKRIAIVTVTVLIIMTLFYFFLKKCRRPEHFFLVASLILGTLYLFVMPVFLIPDSVNHYVRAYGIAHGTFLINSTGMIDIPKNLVPYVYYSYSPYIVLKNFNMTIDTASVISHDVVNMALYSPLSYVLQSTGIGLADIFSNNTYVLVFAGSLVNFIGCTAIIYYSIKHAPYAQYLLTFLALLPMCMQERCSLSVDAITFAMIIAVLSFSMAMRASKQTMARRQIALMFVILIMLASCKVVYFIAGLVILLIPSEKFGSKTKGVICKLTGLIVLAVFSLSWIAIASSYLGTTRGGGDSGAKVSYILHNPVRYYYILNKMTWENGENYILEAMGSKLGCTNIYVSTFLFILVLGFLLKLFYEEKNRLSSIPHDYKAGLWTGFISLMMIVLVYTSLYLQWTALEASTYSVEGVQGRYFLPILPFILFTPLIKKDGEQFIANENNNTGSNDPCSLSAASQAMKPIFALFVFNLLCLVDIFGHGSFVG